MTKAISLNHIFAGLLMLATLIFAAHHAHAAYRLQEAGQPAYHPPRIIHAYSQPVVVDTARGVQIFTSGPVIIAGLQEAENDQASYDAETRRRVMAGYYYTGGDAGIYNSGAYNNNGGYNNFGGYANSFGYYGGYNTGYNGAIAY